MRTPPDPIPATPSPASAPGAPRTDDVHAHWYPREWLELLARDGKAEGVVVERVPGGYRFAGAQPFGFDDGFVELEPRLQAMDRTRIDVHALSLTAPMVYWASPGLGLALSEAFNDAASAAHRKYPERFVGLAMLPMQAPELALRELERAARLPGLRGLYLATNVGGTDLDDRKYWEIYARAEALGWPLFLHPVVPLGGRRLARFHLGNLLGNPYENAIAAASLIFGGVLDAFPRLEVCLPHAGGALPAVIGRLDHGTRVRPELRHMPRLPSEYLRRFHYDCIGHDDRIQRQLVELVGADRVLLGSDYCFDMGLGDPVGCVERIAGIGESERRAILGATAARLLGLG